MRRILMIMLATIISQKSFGADTAPVKEINEKSDKVDLKALEEKYWSAKDDDLGVVQNRAYTKTNRIFTSIGIGPLINDEWIVGQVTHLSAGYFFSEHWGLELSYNQGTLRKNDGVDRIAQQNGLQPDHNKFIDSTLLYGTWVPFYGKMSLADKKIIYFDMQFGLGIGQVSYENQIDPAEGSSQKSSATAIGLDITQQFFFSNHLAVRVDLKNRWSTQKVQKYRVSGSTTGGRNLPDKSQQDTTFQVGLTFFY